MKGLILAGGTGSRLGWLTRVINKHLLPVFDKPMIYYPLTNLILMGAREICLVCNEHDVASFKRLLGNGEEFGVSFEFVVQHEPKGLPDAILSAGEFLQSSPYALILGDNFFSGSGLGRSLSRQAYSGGAQVFGFRVEDPEHYGVVEFDSDGKIEALQEKPLSPPSNVAVTGLYLLDESSLQRAEALALSGRGELEITALLNSYLKDGKLSMEILPRGTLWLDLGRPENLLEASNYVRIFQERTGQKIGDPFEAASVMGYFR